MNVGTVSISNTLQRGRISLDGDFELNVEPERRHPGRPRLGWYAVYVEHVQMIEKNRSDTGGGAVAGLSPWILKDFRAPVRVLPGIQDGYNRKGLVSAEGRTQARIRRPGRVLPLDQLKLDWYCGVELRQSSIALM
jgi:hypothetical protein